MKKQKNIFGWSSKSIFPIICRLCFDKRAQIVCFLPTNICHKWVLILRRFHHTKFWNHPAGLPNPRYEALVLSVLRFQTYLYWWPFSFLEFRRCCEQTHKVSLHVSSCDVFAQNCIELSTDVSFNFLFFFRVRVYFMHLHMLFLVLVNFHVSGCFLRRYSFIQFFYFVFLSQVFFLFFFF